MDLSLGTDVPCHHSIEQKLILHTFTQVNKLLRHLCLANFMKANWRTLVKERRQLSALGLG